MSEWNAETAEWYAEKYGDYPTNRLAVNELDLLDHSSIVDVGCGTGSALRHAASMTAGGKLIGIDPVPRMIEIAKELTKKYECKNRIEYRVGSAEQLPIDNDFAKYVFAFDSIDHWQDIDKGLREIKRILQPDGTFAIVKDKSVPGAKKAIKTLMKNLESAGFEISAMKEISKEEINFLLLICSTWK
jgi:ubiquinone/menaquinone biosynthesis C-methylase UbiE